MALLMNWASLIASVVGLVFSAIAAYQAKSARDAVRAVLEKNLGQEDRDRVTRMISQMTAARTTVTQWMPGLGQTSRGRKRGDDLASLYAALDTLRTASPIKPVSSLKAEIDKCADLLDAAIGKLSSDPADENGWTDARNALQSLHPHLESAERELKLSQLQ